MMRRADWTAPAIVCAFVAGGLWREGRGFDGKATAIGFVDDSAAPRLVAGVVYHDFQPAYGSIEASAYARCPRWLTRAHLRDLLAFPFEELGCRIVIFRISEHNRRALRICRALGCAITRIPDLRAPGHGECVAVLGRTGRAVSKFMKGSEYGPFKRSKIA